MHLFRLSTGVTLIEANNMIFTNLPWRDSDYRQACDRIHRLGQQTECFITTLILDTGKDQNLSTRMEEVLSWSSDMFEKMVVPTT